MLKAYLLCINAVHLRTILAMCYFTGVDFTDTRCTCRAAHSKTINGLNKILIDKGSLGSTKRVSNDGLERILLRLRNI